MAFSELIKNFSKIVNEYLDKYLKLTAKEPLKDERILEIKNILEKNTNTYLKQDDKLKEFIFNLGDEFNKVISAYDEKTKILINELNEHLEENEKIKNHLISDLNTEIETAKIKNENQEQETKLDVSSFINSSSQHIEIFKDENIATHDRFNYQYLSAKESYSSSIIKYNDELKEKLRVENERYKERLESYDEETKEMISSYKADVASKEDNLALANYEYNKLNNDFQEKRKKESTKLNNEIRNHVKLRNDEIAEARSTYTSSQDKASLEREEKKNQYQEESKKTTRDFVFNVNELEKEENKSKNKYETELRNETNSRTYSLYKIHKQQEQELKTLYDTGVNNFSTRKKAKYINKFYYHQKQQIKSDSDKTLTRLKSNYEEDMLQNDYQKKILDIGRTTSFDILNEKEIKDNKYYQELNNLYENILNFNIYKANNKYTESANDVRLISDIIGVDLDKSFEEEEAECQIKIEKITSEIKKKNLEINLALEMQKVIHDYEDVKHEKTISYYTVSNLLTIEKFKVLDNFNTRRYNLNIESADLDLDYAIKKVNLQNEKYSALSNEKIKINKKELEKFINSNKHKMVEQELNSNHEETLIKRNFSYENDVIVQNVLDKRFAYEIKNLNYTISTFTSFTSQISSFINKFVNNTLFEVAIPFVDAKFLATYINGMLKNILNYYKDLLDSLRQNIFLNIESRIKFEEDFKFRKIEDENKENNAKDVALVRAKIKEAKDKIKLINDINEDIRKTVSNIDFEISQERKNKNDGNLKKIAENKEKIENYLLDINANEAIIAKENKTIIKYQEDLKTIEFNNQDTIKSLKEIQHNNAIAYYNLRTNILNLVKQKTNKIDEDFEDYLRLSYNKFSLELLYGFIDKLTIFFDEINVDIYSISVHFKNEAIKNNAITMKKIIMKYEKDINRINASHGEKLKEEKEKYEEKNEYIIDELRDLHKEKDDIEEKYNILIYDNEIIKQRNVNNNIIKRRDNTNQFYIELYAVNDNSNDITNEYNDFIKDNDLKFENNKALLINNVNNECHNIDEDLNKYILSKKELVSQLPAVVKERKRELSENNKLKHKELVDNLYKEQIAADLRAKDLNKILEQIETNYNESIDKINFSEKRLKSKERKAFNNKRYKLKVA